MRHVTQSAKDRGLLDVSASVLTLRPCEVGIVGSYFVVLGSNVMAGRLFA